MTRPYMLKTLKTIPPKNLELINKLVRTNKLVRANK